MFAGLWNQTGYWKYYPVQVKHVTTRKERGLTPSFSALEHPSGTQCDLIDGYSMMLLQRLREDIHLLARIIVHLDTFDTN
uniref:Uncharacterized protein n=1 Tax=Oryza sativa subsp. japonica TaxID=39947 RepID=Q6ZE28_ORYSJ|nr:hypothetical protein [Oryza sativa Japonica Group]